MLSRHLVRLLPLAPKSIVLRVAARYVAGDNADRALAATAQLNDTGFQVTLALLGEHLRSTAEIDEVVAAYIELFDRIEAQELDATISVKPTHVGLDVSNSLCLDHLTTLAEAAERHSSFLRLDMEDRQTTDRTIDFYTRLRRQHDSVGLVLQAYLRRTLTDVAALPDGANVRLCKGIYAEPEEAAFQGRAEIRESFLATLEALFDRPAFVAIATHDQFLIKRSEELIRRRGLGRDDYEFQMLLGVGHRLRNYLLERGHALRIYVPFGPNWYAYSLRRLEENPRIAGHILRALVGGS